MSEPKNADVLPKAKSRTKAKVWPWFLVGFLFIFVGASVLCPMTYFNGRFAYSTRLWQFYLMNIRDARGSGYLGPMSGNFTAAIFVFVLHIVGSTIAGVVSAIVVSLVRNRSPKV